MLLKVQQYLIIYLKRYTSKQTDKLFTAYFTCKTIALQEHIMRLYKESDGSRETLKYNKGTRDRIINLITQNYLKPIEILYNLKKLKINKKLSSRYQYVSELFVNGTICTQKKKKSHYNGITAR